MSEIRVRELRFVAGRPSRACPCRWSASVWRPFRIPKVFTPWLFVRVCFDWNRPRYFDWPRYFDEVRRRNDMARRAAPRFSRAQVETMKADVSQTEAVDV